MRYSFLLLALISGAAFAQGTKAPISKAQFEERFRAADQNKDNKLSRDEAYAAFPRMPAFFDQIDSNKDGYITLAEVNRAVDKHVSKTLANSRQGSQYIKPQDLKSGVAGEQADPARVEVFSSKAEARRQHRYDYYESLAEHQELKPQRGDLPAQETAPAQLQKKF